VQALGQEALGLCRRQMLEFGRSHVRYRVRRRASRPSSAKNMRAITTTPS